MAAACAKMADLMLAIARLSNTCDASRARGTPVQSPWTASVHAHAQCSAMSKVCSPVAGSA